MHPLSNLALERHRAPKTHFPKSWDHFQFIRAIFQIFFAKCVSKLQNYRYSTIWAKNAKNFNFCNFWATSTIYTSKECIFQVEFNYGQKKYDLLKKKWKKLIFSVFWSKIMLTSWLQQQFFCNWWKKFQKWLFQDLLEGLKWKVTKYEHANFNKLEMADDKHLGGARGAPPAFLG